MTEKKSDFPVSDARRYLEPGPVALISSRWQGRDNIMTLGWHTILEFTPSLWGAMISSGNHSHRMIRESGECVVNLPSADMIDTVSRIGNCDGDNMDKFEEFGLTTTESVKVGVPGIAECHASLSPSVLPIPKRCTTSVTARLSRRARSSRANPCSRRSRERERL